MRGVLVVLLSVCAPVWLAGCGSDSGDSGEGGDPPAPGAGFQITTPDITIAAGDERTYCYYTTIDVDETVGVKRWSSTMTPGSHHLILYFTQTENEPEGTISENCNITGGAGLANPPIWTYSAQLPEAQNVMPEGVAMKVGARQPAIVQMHYFNATPEDLQAHVVINAETYAAGEAYTPAGAFITFNTQIEVPPNGTASAQGACSVPDGAQFFTLSTHAHRRATLTEVRDGDSLVFSSDDWEHPGTTDWAAPPHYSFSEKLSYRCEYQNDLAQTVTTGDSADTDEMCMAIGYFFPSEKPVFCINSLTVPL